MNVIQFVNVNTLLKDVKRDLMFHTILNMRHYKLTVKDAQYLAQDFLVVLPATTIEDLLLKLYELGKNYEEARIVFIKYAVEYYEQKEQKILHEARKCIKKGDIDKALEILKKGEYV